MNWILIATGIIFLICMIVGLYRGAVKIAVSLLATVVTFILVFFMTPYVSSGIAAATPLDEMIERQAEQSITSMASSVLQGEDSGAAGGLTVDNVRRVLESAGISETQLNAAGVTVEDIVNGNVTDAMAGVPGTTINDTKLWKAAEKAALGSKFNASSTAPIKQTGTITYFFKLK